MKNVVVLIGAAAVIFSILVLPNYPDALKLSALYRFPLELPIILLVLLAVGRRRGVALGLALALLGATVLKLADIGMFAAYNRVFNPVLDMFLINAGIGLLGDSIGKPLTYLGIVVAIGLLLAAIYLILRSLQVWAAVSVPAKGRLAAAVGAVTFGV